MKRVLSVGIPALLAVVWVIRTGPVPALAGEAIPNLEPYKRFQLIKHDEDCCTACVKKKHKPKVCKTFCGKDSDDQCDDFEDGKITPLEYQPCYPICQDQCSRTRGSLTVEECIIDCLNRTRCPD